MNPTATRALTPVDLATLPPYAPTAFIDFSKPDVRAAFERALADVRGQFGLEAPIVIGGQREKGEGTFESRNPSRPAEVLGRFQSGVNPTQATK